MGDWTTLSPTLLVCIIREHPGLQSCERLWGMLGARQMYPRPTPLPGAPQTIWSKGCEQMALGSV